MKTKQFKQNYKKKLIHIQYLKTKTYKYSQLKKTKINESKNNITKLNLKKISHILYEYDLNNKIILFLDFPTNLYIKLKNYFKKTKHIFISNKQWVRGLLTNSKISLKTLKKTHQNKLPNNKKIDLIVLFNHPIKPILLNEVIASQIPTITLSEKSLITTQNSLTYIKYFNYITKQTNDNFIYSILAAIIKKTLLIKQKKINYKKKIIKILKKKKKKKYILYNKKFTNYPFKNEKTKKFIQKNYKTKKKYFK